MTWTFNCFYPLPKGLRIGLPTSDERNDNMEVWMVRCKCEAHPEPVLVFAETMEILHKTLERVHWPYNFVSEPKMISID